MASVLKVDTIKSLAGNEAITISESGVPLLNVPAFRGYLSASQSITSATVTKVNIDTVTGDNFYDTNDWFDTTNNRYTPQIAGYYFFNGLIRMTGTSQSLQLAYLYKNGSLYTLGQINRESTGLPMFSVVLGTAYMNGTTDYMELHGVIAAINPQFEFSNTGNSCFFEGFLVRGA